MIDPKNFDESESLRIMELEMSNERLIAELGRIALALGVEPSMNKVLAKIEELNAKAVKG